MDVTSERDRKRSLGLQPEHLKSTNSPVDNTFGIEVFKGKFVMYKNCSTLLVAAARNCKFQIASTILSQCPSINVNDGRNSRGETALHVAAANGYLYLVQHLLKAQNINIDSQVLKYVLFVHPFFNLQLASQAKVTLNQAFFSTF